MKLEDIERLILDQVQEGTELEYKAAPAIKDKEEISRDVSAMANSNGGVIIYGVAEFQAKDKRHLPEKIDSIDLTRFNREYLDQVIQSNIRPAPQVNIDPIDLSGGHGIFVVNVSKGVTAHQAADKRYHRRSSFTIRPMEDYEIRDIMNRSKNPLVKMHFKILSRHGPPSSFFLVPQLFNDSTVLARFVRSIYEVPTHFIGTSAFGGNGEKIKIGEYHYARFEATNQESNVIHAGLKVRVGPVKVHAMEISIIQAIERGAFHQFTPFDIFWKVYADNADVVEGKTTLLDIWNTSGIRLN